MGYKGEKVGLLVAQSAQELDSVCLCETNCQDGDKLLSVNQKKEKSAFAMS